MKILAILLALFYQGRAPGPLTGIRTILHAVVVDLDAHRPTFGATAELTTAKHELRNWIESELAAQNQEVDTAAFADRLQKGLGDADLLCIDCTARMNYLGAVYDVRVIRRRFPLCRDAPSAIFASAGRVL